MKKIYQKLIIGLMVCSTVGASAQEKKNTGSAGGSGYTTGIGLRGGWDGGVTVKHFISDGRALEGIFSRPWGWGGFRVTGLYEVQKPTSGLEGLSWFYGVGGHIGFFDERYYGYDCKNGGYWDGNGNWHSCKDRYMTIGIDGILGLEYKIQEIPFTLGVDIKPYIDLVGWGANRFGDGAFSVRYVF